MLRCNSNEERGKILNKSALYYKIQIKMNRWDGIVNETEWVDSNVLQIHKIPHIPLIIYLAMLNNVYSLFCGRWTH